MRYSFDTFRIIFCLLCAVSARGQGGVHCSVSSDHVIAEQVRPIHREHQLGPAMGAGGLEGDGQGEIPDNPEQNIKTCLTTPPSLTVPPCLDSSC